MVKNKNILADGQFLFHAFFFFNPLLLIFHKNLTNFPGWAKDLTEFIQVNKAKAILASLKTAITYMHTDG